MKVIWCNWNHAQNLNINWSLTGYFVSTIPQRSRRRILLTGTGTLLSPSWGSSWGRPDTSHRLTLPLPWEKESMYSNEMHHSIIITKNLWSITNVPIVIHGTHRPLLQHYKMFHHTHFRTNTLNEPKMTSYMHHSDFTWSHSTGEPGN